jgi:hypothetical protein
MSEPKVIWELTNIVKSARLNDLPEICLEARILCEARLPHFLTSAAWIMAVTLS